MIPKLKIYVKETKQIEDVMLIHFDSEVVKALTGIWYAFDEVVIMQSTGLFDKHGVEIFEGDVVKLQEGHQSYYIVEWHDSGMWIFRYVDDKKQYYAFNTVIELLKYPSLECEVVGNIYSNPEMLEIGKEG